MAGALVMLRCVLAWRGIATADVAALGAAAKVEPPTAGSCQAFDATRPRRFCSWINAVLLRVHDTKLIGYGDPLTMRAVLM